MFLGVSKTYSACVHGRWLRLSATALAAELFITGRYTALLLGSSNFQIKVVANPFTPLSPEVADGAQLYEYRGPRNLMRIFWMIPVF